MQVDTLLQAKYTLVYENGQFCLKEAWQVGVQGSRITYVGPRDSKVTARQTLNFDQHLLSPGFVNTHTHLPMSLFRGLADNLSLKAWLESWIFPLETRFVDEKFIQVGTQLASLELIKSGVTCVYDMYFYNEMLAQEVCRAGLRAVVGVGVPTLDEKAKDYAPYTLDLREKYKQESRITIAIAPHAPYTLSKETLAEVAQFSKEAKLPLIIHVAETKQEQEDIQALQACSPIEYLHNLGLTGPNSLFVHCVHASDKDLEILKDTDTGFSYNPSSNMKLSSGIAPCTQAVRQGVRVGLGTDGAASNNNLNFLQEMNLGAKLQCLKYGSEHALNPQEMFFMSCLGGASTLGLEKEIGSLEVGKQADIIAIDVNQPWFLPDYNLLSHLTYSALGSEVTFTMCGGQILMQDREMRTLDEKNIYKESKNLARKIEDFFN